MIVAVVAPAYCAEHRQTAPTKCTHCKKQPLQEATIACGQTSRYYAPARNTQQHPAFSEKALKPDKLVCSSQRTLAIVIARTS